MTFDSIAALLPHLERVKRLAKECIADKGEWTDFGNPEKIIYFLKTGKRTGELRRASLDLTRRLSEMRNPRG